MQPFEVVGGTTLAATLLVLIGLSITFPELLAVGRKKVVAGALIEGWSDIR